MARTKPKVSKREVSFDPSKVDPAKLEKLDGKLFHPIPDGAGVTIGRELSYGECEGNALLDWKKTKALLAEFQIEFDVRVTCDHSGKTYLEIAQRGHSTYFSFPFQGIDARDAIKTTIDFQSRVGRNLAYGIYELFWAIYRSFEPDRKRRKDAFDKLLANCRERFSNLLKLKRERPVNSTVTDGITITEFERIESGRNPQTAEEVENDKREFHKMLSDAFAEAKQDKVRLTQDSIASRMFPKLSTEAAKAKFHRLLTKHQMNWPAMRKNCGKLY
ncbi:MAG: hypothetical protein ABI539_05170 [Acidobacteriota bacterium]